MYNDTPDTRRRVAMVRKGFIALTLLTAAIIGIDLYHKDQEVRNFYATATGKEAQAIEQALKERVLKGAIIHSLEADDIALVIDDSHQILTFRFVSDYGKDRERLRAASKAKLAVWIARKEAVLYPTDHPKYEEYLHYWNHNLGPYSWKRSIPPADDDH